jgi:hypothetical protein
VRHEDPEEIWNRRRRCWTEPCGFLEDPVEPPGPGDGSAEAKQGAQTDQTPMERTGTDGGPASDDPELPGTDWVQFNRRT